MVLNYLGCKNSQNLKSNNIGSFEHKQNNNRDIYTSNVSHNVILNNSSAKNEWDQPNTTSSLNSNNSTALRIYHQDTRGLQNKTDEQ